MPHPSLETDLPTASNQAPPASDATSRGTLATLLGGVEEVTTTSSSNQALQDKLVFARLGVASSLFAALRAKHSPSAQHSLRVALRCSLFSKLLGLPAPLCDHLEIAALLHDVGKIGVPDHILSKPGKLSESEVELMQRHHGFCQQILQACVANEEVLEIVRCASFRYDGRGQDPPVTCGEAIPIGGRILAIADAYDAMTTEHVYRAAMPRERALAELFENAGTQFDPHLVRSFAHLSPMTEAEINQQVTTRWTQHIQPQVAHNSLNVNQPLFENLSPSGAAWLFQQRLLDAMHDGVIFIDSGGRILLWNRGAERLTGVSRESILEKNWSCSILDFRDTEGNLIRESQCPVTHVVQTGVQTFRRLTLTRTRGDRVTVDLHVFPVTDAKRRCFGATILLHDVSSEMTLEKRVQNLHARATTDPLTGVNNRAEFDRVHQAMVAASLASGLPCSIIITDIDRFKQVNDVYGHQAGDEALISFAALLRQYSREGDLVARYGGEEFVMLCPECDNAAAARRAEEIRFELAKVPQPMLNQKCITASFGVTEVQMGDTPETMLRRADRALYQAKDSGRNRVVQLGAGLMHEEPTSQRHWLNFLQRRQPDCLLERKLVANVPLNVLVEKIRGFISDHGAEIVNIEENYVVLSVDDCPDLQRRASDRPVALVLELKLREVSRSEHSRTAHGTRTVIEVAVRPKRSRDRRRQNADQAAQLVASLKSYLIAQECPDL